MDKKIIIWVGVVVVLGVGGYFGYKAYKKSQDKKNGGDATTKCKSNEELVTETKNGKETKVCKPKSSGSGTPTGGGGTGSGVPNADNIFDKVSNWLKGDSDNFLLDDGIGGSIDKPENTFLSALEYSKKNPDVREYWNSSPYSHYIQNGKAEGRTWKVIPSVSFVKANTINAANDYFKRYPDVKQNWDGSPYLHFWTNGIKEGRTWNYNL
jgi:hypothetical protein